MTVALEALGSLVFRTYELPKDVWRDDVVHVDGLHSEAFEEILDRHRHLKSGGDVSNLVIEGRPGVGKTHFLGRVRAYVAAQGDFFVYVDLSSTRDFWQSLVEYYLASSGSRVGSFCADWASGPGSLAGRLRPLCGIDPMAARGAPRAAAVKDGA